MTIVAAIGATALYLLFVWLASAIAASYLSDRKGWGEKPGLASGLLGSAVAPLIWLAVPRRPDDLAPGAAATLVTGIVGVILFPVAGPFAWKQGTEVEQEIDASGETLSGRGIATVGKILGMIGTAELVIGIVTVLTLAAVD